MQVRKTLLRWGPWNYRFWRELTRWCYEQGLKNPPVVNTSAHFPASGELQNAYTDIRRETLEVALSGRLPANHEIMEQQRTLYEFCLLYTSPSPRDLSTSRMPSSA